MNEIKILHLTDLHINDFSVSSQEYLRLDFYKKYIDGLVEALPKDTIPISALIVTGDFIDRGKVNNFVHASSVIDYLRMKLKMLPESIGVCVGNHDIKATYVDGELKTESDDREDYYLFSEQYVNKKGLIHKSERFTLCKINDNIYYLALDSTLNRTANKPGKLRSEENNEIIEVLKESKINHPNNLLIIGSHYPLALFSNFPPEDGWFDSHVWKSASHLRSEIQSFINQAKILYLFGDTHQPSREEKNNELFIMSGRIGTKVFDPQTDKAESDSHINREAKLIHYKVNNSVDIQSFFYHQETHAEDRNKGCWSTETPIPISYKIDRAELIRCSHDPDFEDKIIDYIIDNDLYSFGKFKINNAIDHDERVSLGWVSINNLMADRNQILPGLVKGAKEWLETLSKELLDQGKVLFVGIDFWGAIIASHLSLVTGNQNICLASRGKTKDYSKFESDIKSLDPYGSNIFNQVVFITDVVSSGGTLCRIFNKINSLFVFDKVSTTYIAISVISDRSQKKKSDISFLSSFGTFCCNLRIPVLDKEDLPGDDIIPSSTYFD